MSVRELQRWQELSSSSVPSGEEFKQHLAAVCALPTVLASLVLEYEPRLLRLCLSTVSLEGHPKAVLHTSFDKTYVYVRRGRHHGSWAVVGSQYVEDRNHKVPKHERQETAVAYQRCPIRPLAVFRDEFLSATLHGTVLTLVRLVDGAKTVISTGRAAAETRLCRVLGYEHEPERSPQFRVAVVRDNRLHVREPDSDKLFDSEGLNLPAPPYSRGPWHVVGLAALADLTLVHVSTSRGESLLVAQVGMQPPVLARLVLPELQLRTVDSVLGVTNFGADSLVVGIHEPGCEKLVRIKIT
jgi:hypothetical protein